MLEQKSGSWWKRVATVLRHPYLTLVSRIALGGIFVFAGAAKISHISPLYPVGQMSLFQEIMQYKVLPQDLAIAYSYVLPPLEILLGILLIAGILLKTSAVLGGLITLSFTIAKIQAMIRGLDIFVCNCFGPAMPLLSVYSLAIDVVMLALAIQIFFHRKEFLAFGPWIKGIVDRAKAEEKSSGTTPPPL